MKSRVTLTKPLTVCANIRWKVSRLYESSNFCKRCSQTSNPSSRFRTYHHLQQGMQKFNENKQYARHLSVSHTHIQCWFNTRKSYHWLDNGLVFFECLQNKKRRMPAYYFPERYSLKKDDVNLIHKSIHLFDLHSTPSHITGEYCISFC